jgi:uncharacterized damage-inducible protein DinB
MRRRSLVLVSALLAASVAFGVAAAAEEAREAPASGFRSEFLVQLDDVEKKLVALAGAIPVESYTWRPGEGVRSTSEVFLHVAGGNYFLPTFLGLQPPVSWTPEMEKETDKAKVLAALEESLAYLRRVVTEIPDADLDRAVQFFGRDSTVRGVLFLAANHLHEHLGQLIAYARVNGVVPPWSVPRPAEG